MAYYLVSIHRPHNYDPSVSEDDTMRGEIDALNAEMVTAGVRVFAGGLKPPRTAKSLRRLPDGQVSVSEGLYLKSTEHVGGFWVLDVPCEGEALEWGRKASVACRAPVEVRPFH